MFEYHGWISIIVAPYDVENEDEKLHQVVTYSKNLIEQTLPKHHIAELKPINGEYMASFAGLANHSSSVAEAIISIFKKIGQKAPGSYGILYFWNDEDTNSNNKFSVGRLARGKFEVLEDCYLSPRIPKLEDPCS